MSFGMNRMNTLSGPCSITDKMGMTIVDGRDLAWDGGNHQGYTTQDFSAAMLSLKSQPQVSATNMTSAPRMALLAL